jgi:L-aspartate oxidase
MDTLIAAVRKTPSIRVIEHATAETLIVEDGRVVGVRCRKDGAPLTVLAPDVVLATGGVGGLYAVTTNPGQVRGEGLGMAARAGAMAGDPEFVQFHPTGLAVDLDPTPLASEALRGEGATLIDETGARIMDGVHPDMELAPRDIVARAIHRRVAAGGTVFLDTRDCLGAKLATTFPTIHAACVAAGIDPLSQPIPVRPAQHYHMGGVLTDGAGRSSLPGLWACGETACTGLHGANRLASNSLLEALVFAARIAVALHGDGDGDAPRAAPSAPPAATPSAPTPPDLLAALRTRMSLDVGVERDAPGLTRALAFLDDAARDAAAPGGGESLRNMLAAATLIAAAALKREESRGGHSRRDFPNALPGAPARTRMTLAEAEAIRATAAAS